MNRYAQQCFESIMNEANSHREEVGRILATFQKEKTQAEVYKDSAGKTKAAAAKARNSILLAVNAFSGSIQPDIENLRNELYTYLLTVPNDKAINALNLYKQIDNVSEIEAAALLEKVNGNYIGLRLLDSIIKKGGLRVKFPDVSEFENDLKVLEALSSESYIAPDEFFNPLCEIFTGEPRPMPGADGKTLQNAGFVWSATNFATTRAVFNAHVAEIPNMIRRWTAQIKPVIFRSEVYEDDVEAAAAAFVADTESRSKGTIQPDLDAAAAARAQAHAERETAARQVRESYIKH